MATAKAKLQGLSEQYVAEMQQKNDNFQNECTRFLEDPYKKVLLNEASSLVWKTSIVKRILNTLEGDLKLRYGGVKNQMFLRWTQFRSVADTLEMLPKLPNLVVFEFDKTITNEHDVDMFKKLVKRLSMGAHKKIMVMTVKLGMLKSVYENIDISVLCMLEEEDNVMKNEEKFNSACKLMTKTKNLFEAASKGNLFEVVLLIESGANVDQTGDSERNTPLHKAAENGHTGVVLKLLQHGAKHLQNSGKYTPLHLAALNGHNETVIIFLEHDIDVNVRGHKVWTPLHYASCFGRHVIVKTLLEYDADIEAKDDRKETALHLAAYRGHEMIVKTLLDYGAQANASIHQGWTPLHYAVYKNNLEIVKILVEQKNANLNSTDEYGQTPLDLAKSSGRSAIVEYLTLNLTIYIS